VASCYVCDPVFRESLPAKLRGVYHLQGNNRWHKALTAEYSEWRHESRTLGAGSPGRLHCVRPTHPIWSFFFLWAVLRYFFPTTIAYSPSCLSVMALNVYRWLRVRVWQGAMRGWRGWVSGFTMT
jgi:hypothetical protein